MIPNIYPNIDLHYNSNNDGLKIYFVVKPGGNAGDIQLNFNGNINTLINSNNQLLINSSLGNFGFKPAKIYNITSPVSTATVSGGFSLFSPNNYKFNIGPYITSLPLVISLEQIQTGVGVSSTCDWSTFYGGSGFETSTKVITDALGNSFLIGQTDSPNFPNLSGGYLTTTNGLDGFIVKLNSSGAGVWGTFYGGNATIGSVNCLPKSIAINSANEIYITGNTDNATLPLVPAANTNLQGGLDAFIAKFNSAGNSLLFSRYLGGNGTDNANDIAISNTGDVYLVGNSSASSSGFPLTNPLGGAYYQSISTGNDGFIAKINSSNNLQWSSFFGGSDKDEIQSIKILPNGNILTSGYTYSTIKASANSSNPICGVPLSASDYPDCTPSGAYTQAFGGGLIDAFIVEYNPNGSLAWSTYYGTTSDEISSRIVLKPGSSNEFYLVGNAGSQNGQLSVGPVGSYIQNYNPSGNIPRGFITKFVNRQPVWHTLVGEGNQAYINDAVCDNSGNIYVTGKTQTSGYTSGPNCQPVAFSGFFTEFPKCFPSGIFNKPTYGGGGQGDAYIIGFNSANQMVWSSFYGAGSTDEGVSLAFDAATNKLCFTGFTQSGAGGFPLFNPNTGNYQQNTNAGSSSSFLNPTANRDCFFAKFCLTSIPTTIKDDNLDKLVNNSFIYPNPNNGTFNVSLANFNNENCHYKIFDLTGKQIEEGDKEISNNFINFKLLPSIYKQGIYLLKVNSNKNSTVVKFIVE